MSKLIEGGIYKVKINNENSYRIGELIICCEVVEETNDGVFSNVDRVIQIVSGKEVELIYDDIVVGDFVKIVSVDKIDEVMMGVSLGDVVKVLSPPDEDGVFTVGTNDLKYGYLHISQVEGI